MVKDSPFTVVYSAFGNDLPSGFDSSSISDVEDASVDVLKSSSVTAKKDSVKKKGRKTAIVGGRSRKGGRGEEYLRIVSAAAPDLVDGLNSLSPELRRTLLSSAFGSLATQDANEVAGRLRPVIEDIRQGGQTITVAILDLDARLGRLPYLIEVLNSAQPLFTFLDLQAPVPAGLLIPSDRFDSWARHRAGRKRFSKEEREEFADNFMFNDFYKYARGVRETSGVEYLAGITRYMIAGEEAGSYYWNYFSVAYRKVILASAYNLREYATKAERPFEVAVTMLLLAALVADLNKNVEYHDDSGCIFDLTMNRPNIVKSLKRMEIESECLRKIEPKYRSAVQAIVTALRNYQRPPDATPALTKKKRATKKRDDSYWLAQLNKLSEKLKKV